MDLQHILELLKTQVDWLYFAVFMVASYAFKGLLYDLLNRLFYYNKKDKQPSMHWVVAIIGIIIAIPFLLFPDLHQSSTVIKTVEDGKYVFDKAYGLRIFITYCVGTTVYDLLFRQVDNLIRKTNSANNETTS